MTAIKQSKQNADPIPVSDNLIRIYEQSYGFKGIGKIMLRAGFWILSDTKKGTL